MPTVIKAGESGAVLRRLSTVDLADHLREARAVVDSAQCEAGRILAEARAERERACDEAKQAGYAAGYGEGFAAGEIAGRQAALEESRVRFEIEQADLVADLTRVVAELDRRKGDLQISAEQHLLEFAIGLAVKMTFAVGRLHRDAVVENFKRALELVGSQTDLTVRIHPSDHAAMVSFAEQVRTTMGKSRCMSLVADEQVAPGGCIVDTRQTRVDAGLSTQIDEIVGLLLGATDAADIVPAERRRPDQAAGPTGRNTMQQETDGA